MMQDEVYEKAKALLINKDGSPTQHYQAYMKYEEEWQKKVKTFNEAYINASGSPSKLQRWPIEGKLFHHDTDQAWDRWIALGFKNEIENSVDIISALATDPVILDIVRKVQNQKK